MNEICAALLIVCFLGGTAQAADTPTSTAGAILVYPSSYFAGEQLNTAYDMVTRVPGFVFTDTNTQQRGYAGSMGNVFINGAPPASKTDILSDVLKRISIADVDRIEVIRGGAPGIDMQGLSVIANVILKAGGNHVIVTLANTIYGDGHDGPAANVEFTGQWENKTYDLQLSRINQINDDSAGNGIGITAHPGQGVVINGSHRRGTEKVGYGLNGSWVQPLLEGNLSTNLVLQETSYHQAVIYDAPGQADFPALEKLRNAELGGHWDRQFGAAELNIVAIQRLQRDQNDNAAITPGEDQFFHSVSDTGESILRGTLRYLWSPDLMLEGGLEGAYNFLDGSSSYINNGAVVPLPGSNPTVNEKRGEAFLQSSWKIAPGWSLEAGARVEHSTIAAKGVPSRSFTFLKPRLLVSWSPSEASQFRFRAERTVGQLDFSNFIASTNFSQNGVNAGNENLSPDQHWQFEGDYEYHFWERGAFVLSITRDYATDLVDYVPIGNGLDGPGNLRKGLLTIYDAEISVPLDRLGITGGTLKPSLVWRDTSTKDPVTGQTRQISNTRDHTIQIAYLEDIRSLNSSLEFDAGSMPYGRDYYRINQVTHLQLSTPYFGFQWDYKPEPDLDLQFQLSNLVPYTFDIIEYNYAGPRNISPLVSIQDEHTHSFPRLFVQLRKTF
ncbi:MAG TPA: TonB-dependent receptor [Rhizomicrobium sp.]|nr:TonB-dependent receptor [Rhizomicrobium sp.]